MKPTILKLPIFTLILFIFITLILLMFITFEMNAQVFLKAEYIAPSSFRDENNTKTGGKGSAIVYSGMAQIPLSVKIDDNNRMKAWAIGLGGSYTTFSNKRMTRQDCPPEILNAQLSLSHIRPISTNWSLMASLGGGVYLAHTKLSTIGMRNFMAHGSLLFVWHLKPNLDLGMGLAVNNSFGYPMAFPGVFVNWRLDGRWQVEAQMADAFELSGGYAFTDYFKLKLAVSMNGAMTLEKIDGQNVMFTHQYMVAGLQPEFHFGKLSVPIMLGITAFRPAFYEKRSLKSFFKAMGREYDPYFQVAPYASVGVRYGF